MASWRNPDDWQCHTPTCGNSVFKSKDGVCGRCQRVKGSNRATGKKAGFWRCLKCGIESPAFYQKCRDTRCGWCPRCDLCTRGRCSRPTCNPVGKATRVCDRCNPCKRCAGHRGVDDAVKRLEEGLRT